MSPLDTCDAIPRVRHNGIARQHNAGVREPAIALQTLPVWFEVLWMTINCGFGAAIMRSRQAPVFGTILGGLLVGLGGGIVRDLLLGLEPAAIAVWYYLPCGVLGALAGALLAARILRWSAWTLIVHGVTLGFLVAIGTQKAVMFAAPWFSAMALGVVTASFGGLLADVVTPTRASLVSQAHWVASALCLGAVVFWLLERALRASPAWDLWVPALTCVAVVATVRVTSAVRNWPSPTWQPLPSIQP